MSSGVGSEILTLAEAAKFLKMSKSHLSNLVAGKVPGVPLPPHARVGRRILFRRASLEAWLGELERAA